MSLEYFYRILMMDVPRDANSIQSVRSSAANFSDK